MTDDSQSEYDPPPTQLPAAPRAGEPERAGPRFLPPEPGPARQSPPARPPQSAQTPPRRASRVAVGVGAALLVAVLAMVAARSLETDDDAERATSAPAPAAAPRAVAPGSMPPSPSATAAPNLASTAPLGFDTVVPVEFRTTDDADGSVWNVSVSALRDMTEQVMEANRFNDPPPDGLIFAGFDVELTLASAAREPLATGFDLDWEIVAGSTGQSHGPSSFPGLLGCGVVDGEFDEFAEVFVGGTVQGVVCIPLAVQDLDHADTQVSMTFPFSRVLFAEGGDAPVPAEVGDAGRVADGVERGLDAPVPVTFDVIGDADNSVWNVQVGPPRDITAEVLAANSFNVAPPEDVVFVGFGAALTLASAPREPLAPGLHYTWELIGGATAAVYDLGTIHGLVGCGAHDNSFDHFAELFVGGTVSGLVCIPLPLQDLDHRDTRISLNVTGDRVLFLDGAETPGPAEVESTAGPAGSGEIVALFAPVEVPAADAATWTITVGPPRDITAEIAGAGPFTRPPPDGFVYAGVDIAATLAESAPARLDPAFTMSWEILGGATRRVYDETSTGILRCGSFDGEFDRFAQVDPGETLAGTLCLPIPAADLAHRDTRISMTTPDTRYTFAPD